MIRKFLISSIIGILVSIIAQVPLHFQSNKVELAVTLGFIAFIISFIKVQPGKSSIEMASNALNSVKDIRANLELKDANLYAVAEKEYESGQINQGLWSQALVKAKGDETLRKVEYMKLRVMQLKQK